MGYNLRIGEAFIDYDEDLVRIDCHIVKHDTAPAYGEPTDYTNERWPSYIAWHEAMRNLGLMDVMFDERNKETGEFEHNGITRRPLLQQHPGCAPITLEHVQYVEAKLNAYKAAHPDHRAEYAPPKPGAKPLIEGTDLYKDEDYVDDPRYDANLCKGEWLLYWLKWAYENCKMPVFVNT